MATIERLSEIIRMRVDFSIMVIILTDFYGDERENSLSFQGHGCRVPALSVHKHKEREQ